MCYNSSFSVCDWKEWSVWSECVGDCGPDNGTHTRNRACDGHCCLGVYEETESCTLREFSPSHRIEKKCPISLFLKLFCIPLISSSSLSSPLYIDLVPSHWESGILCPHWHWLHWKALSVLLSHYLAYGNVTEWELQSCDCVGGVPEGNYTRNCTLQCCEEPLQMTNDCEFREFLESYKLHCTIWSKLTHRACVWGEWDWTGLRV